jgi:hypothetical protein
MVDEVAVGASCGHIASMGVIDVPNARPDQLGLATVNPIFTWVRRAQRVPVESDSTMFRYESNCWPA